MIKFFEENYAKDVFKAFIEGNLLENYFNSPQEDILAVIELGKQWAIIPSPSTSKDLLLKLTEVSLGQKYSVIAEKNIEILKNLLFLKKDIFEVIPNNLSLDLDFGILEEDSIENFKSSPFFGVMLRVNKTSLAESTFEETIKTFLNFFGFSTFYSENYINTVEEYQLKEFSMLLGDIELCIQSFPISYKELSLEEIFPSELFIIKIFPRVIADNNISLKNPSQELKNSIKETLKNL